MSLQEFSEHPRVMMDSLNELKTHKQLCDVTIIAGDEKIKVHRLVLVAASKYFKAMFFNDTQESKTGIVDFPATPKDVVKQCIEFIYSGKVEFSLKNITAFMETSDIFGLHNLTEMYVKFLSRNVNLENVMEMITIAQIYKKEILAESIGLFLMTNFAALVKSESYLPLKRDSIAFILSLMDGIGEGNEELKVTAIMNWIKYDRDEREQHFVGLFQMTDASFLSKKFINESILSEDFVYDSKECLQLITKILVSEKKLIIKEKSKQGDFKETGAYERSLTHIVTCNLDTGVVYRGNLKTDVWSRVTELPPFYNMKHLDITEHRGFIYAANGYEMHCFDGMKWQSIWERQTRNMNAPFIFNRCIGSGGYVFTVTGSLVVVYEISTAKIYQLNFLSSHGANFLVANSPHDIYIMGGEKTSKKVTVANIGKRNCGSLPQMLDSRVSGIGLWFQNAVYAIGGGSKSVEFYNTITKQWQIIKNLEIDCIGTKAHVADKLYLFGGGLQTTVKSVELEKFEVSEEDKEPTRRNVQFNVFCGSYS